jgi:hypothetical protein
MTKRAKAALLLACLAGALAAGVGCRGSRARTAAGLDPAALPEEVRADYAVFARRCSKCHALSRPLDSGITSDAYWAIYVDKMRHLPGSGITQEDEVAILRFLKVYAASERERLREEGK